MSRYRLAYVRATNPRTALSKREGELKAEIDSLVASQEAAVKRLEVTRKEISAAQTSVEFDARDVAGRQKAVDSARASVSRAQKSVPK